MNGIRVPLTPSRSALEQYAKSIGITNKVDIELFVRAASEEAFKAQEAIKR